MAEKKDTDMGMDMKKKNDSKVKMLWRKCYKTYEYVITKIVRTLKQKTFNFEGVRLKYIFEKVKSSNELIIVFSSCTRKGIKARYNYIRTLADISVNRLFILDDFAEDKRGSYYIGKNMKFDEERATIELIKCVVAQTNAHNPIFCGSSKGGWAALNFGLLFEHSVMISGAPQFLLGDYLSGYGTNLNNPTLRHIIGENNKQGIELLNHYLELKFEMDEFGDTQKIYLHFSDREETYSEHIVYLLEAIEKTDIQLECDIENYEDHSLISLYYPSFLKTTLRNILNESNTR